jgi:hypothetical protein
VPRTTGTIGIWALRGTGVAGPQVRFSIAQLDTSRLAPGSYSVLVDSFGQASLVLGTGGTAWPPARLTGVTWQQLIGTTWAQLQGTAWQ